MPQPIYIGALRQPNLAKTITSIAPVVEAASLTLLGVERAQEGRRTVLWVYLDHPSGVTLDQCAEVSPEISAILDVEDPIPEAYDLRVSSPGIERPLMSDEQFETYIDHPVQIRLLSPLRGRRKFRGKVISILRGDDGLEADLHLACDDGEHHIPLSLILRARLHYSDDEIKAIFRERRIAERAAAREASDSKNA